MPTDMETQMKSDRERIEELEREVEKLKRENERRLGWPWMPMPTDPPLLPNEPWRYDLGPGLPNPDMDPMADVVRTTDTSGTFSQRVPQCIETRW